MNQQNKLDHMADAIKTLMERYPGRLNVDFEDDHIRTERVMEFDQTTHTSQTVEPALRLQMDIETDLSLLELGHKNDTGHIHREGYMVVEYRLGDTVDNEHHIHFPTAEAVIDYLTVNITSPDERKAVFH